MEIPPAVPPQENSETNPNDQQPKPLRQMTPSEAAAFWKKLGEQAKKLRKETEEGKV